MRNLRLLLKNPYFWGGLFALLITLTALGFLFDEVAMPSFARHGTTVAVPDVQALPFEEAAEELRRTGLRAVREVQRFNPEFPLGVVVDQVPTAQDEVKPGRRVYLTVNAGATPRVVVPPLQGMSLREAQARLAAVGLRSGEPRPDSIPSPYRNTVTRQAPAAGDSLDEGGEVTLWYSTGLGDTYVDVPDVTGMTVEEARQSLLDQRLRAVVVDARDEEDQEPDVTGEEVVRQSRAPGTRVRAGFEIRLFLQEAESGPLEAAPPDPDL